MFLDKTQASLLAALCAGLFATATHAQFFSSRSRTESLLDNRPAQTFGDKVEVQGSHLSANRQTGELSATGDVKAVSGVFRFHSHAFHRNPAGKIDFGRDPTMTTCTNDACDLHWHLSGKAPADWLPSGTFAFQDTPYTDAEGRKIHRALTLHDM